MTMGMLSVTDCDFFQNENGIEAVGSGSLTTTINASRFDENYNFIDGMPHFWSQTVGVAAPFSPGAIAARNMTNALTVRSTTFTNNAFGLIAGSEGTYDFGRNGLFSPGLNVFDFDFSAFTGPDPIRVALYVVSPDAVVKAGGNTWWADNQGADSNGCLTGTVTASFGTIGVNVFDEAVYDAEIDPSLMNASGHFPPGPRFGQFADTSPFAEWFRNYSLLAPATSGQTQIEFGSDCLP